MPAPLDFPAGAPLWIDLKTTDPEKAITFYEKLFGWAPERMGPQFGNYVKLSLDGRQFGGIMLNSPETEPPETSRPDYWRVYLETDDAATTAEAVTGAGGLVFEGPHEVGPLGSMVVALDNDRAVIGAWQRGTNRGFEIVAEPGAPAWFELLTTSYDDALQFYQQAFGWQTNTMSDTPEFRYSQLMVDGAPYAGIMDATPFWAPGAPAQWMVYIAVDDTDATLALAVELGGTMVDAPSDTPFGRLSTLTDPTGAVIKIISGMPTP